ncbi:MAG: MBL fold metallo-hydrolase, partial [Panacagrimonas sp.]
MQSTFKLKMSSLAIGALFAATCAPAVMAGDPPTAATLAANQAVLKALPFDDTRDFDDVKRGFIAPLPHDGVIKSADGAVVYDLSAFGFAAKGAAPGSVNPSLWRQAQLLSLGGLFEVAPRIYQVRSADISNPTFIEGDTGVIVIDPVTTAETGKVAIELYRQHRGNKPVVAVIYTHSHIDHFGGVRGMIDEADVKAGKVRIIAPVGFMEEVAGENVNVGNHMSRRATYQFGNLLPKGPEGSLG